MFLCLFLFTGCGNKTLRCSKDNDLSEDIKNHQELKIKFSGDSMSYLYFNSDVRISEEYLNFKEGLLDSSKSEFKSYDGINGIKYSFSDKKDGYASNLKINFKKLRSEQKKNVHIVDYEATYDEVKQDLEDSGYSCK
jgi:hypothetical protein